MNENEMMEVEETEMIEDFEEFESKENKKMFLAGAGAAALVGGAGMLIKKFIVPKAAKGVGIIREKIQRGKDTIEVPETETEVLDVKESKEH